jgi:hypothetical protein
VEVAFAFEAAMMGSARERIEREGVGAVRVAIAWYCVTIELCRFWGDSGGEELDIVALKKRDEWCFGIAVFGQVAARDWDASLSLIWQLLYASFVAMMILHDWLAVTFSATLLGYSHIYSLNRENSL